jgi:integrase
VGRKGSGVEIRDASIRISFTPAKGEKAQRQTLCVNGEPLKPTPANVKYAHRVASEIRDRIAAGTFRLVDYFPHAAGGLSSDASLGAALDNYIKSKSAESSTLDGYTSAVRFWKRTIGENTPARSVVHSTVLLAIKTRSDLSGKTITNYVSVLRGAFDLLVKDKVLTDNPVGEVAVQYQPPEVDPFTPAEVERILADMREQYPPEVSDYAEIKFFTGLRTSESFGVKRKHIDLDKGIILVNDTIVRGVAKNRTKTSQARLVKMNSRSRAAIERRLDATAERTDGEFLIDPRREEPWFKEQFFTRYFWIPCLERLGIRYRKPYNTRHTYATMMLMAGMKPAFCARQLGHDLEMFFQVYSRWIDDIADDHEMAKLDASILPAASPKSGE